MKNWWYYHKWYVICGIILMGIVIDLIGNWSGWFRDEPDIQIAYIGDNPLPEDMAASIEETFSSLAGDYNHDGKVLVRINQFVNEPAAGDIESLSYQQASEIALIGDIEACDSYFFLMEDPVKVQREFQVLAMPDGSCPSEYDLSADDKVIPWDSQLSLGRRCFYNEERTPYADECSQVWESLRGQNRSDHESLSLLLSGCTSAPQTETDDEQEWQEDWTQIGNFMGIDAPKQLTLLDNKDILAAEGLYYASWTAGSSVSYENSADDTDDTDDLYDAQLYLLASETDDEKSAEKNYRTWLAAAEDNYEVHNKKTITCNGQSYTMITYNCKGEDSAYDRGVSALGVHDTHAVCAELTCTENYDEDLEKLLTEFLDGCHYRK